VNTETYDKRTLKHRMEQIKLSVTRSQKAIKHTALVECFRQGLLPLLYVVSQSLQERIRTSLYEYGLRPWPLCPECKLDPKDGFVHIRRVAGQEIRLKITNEQPFCPNESIVFVVDILQDLHRHLRRLGVTDLNQNVEKRQAMSCVTFASLKHRQDLRRQSDTENSRRYDDFIAILASNVRLDMIFENHCEALKAFSATGAYKNIEFIEDLPMPSVVSIMFNCFQFAKYLNINLRDRGNLLIMVSLYMHIHITKSL